MRPGLGASRFRSTTLRISALYLNVLQTGFGCALLVCISHACMRARDVNRSHAASHLRPLQPMPCGGLGPWLDRGLCFFGRIRLRWKEGVTRITKSKRGRLPITVMPTGEVFEAGLSRLVVVSEKKIPICYSSYSTARRMLEETEA